MHLPYLQAQQAFFILNQTILYAIYTRSKWGIVFKNRIMQTKVTSIVLLHLKWPLYNKVVISASCLIWPVAVPSYKWDNLTLNCNKTCMLLWTEMLLCRLITVTWHHLCISAKGLTRHCFLLITGFLLVNVFFITLKTKNIMNSYRYIIGRLRLGRLAIAAVLLIGILLL